MITIKIPILSKMMEKRSNLKSPEQWFMRAMGYHPTASGVNVTEDTALRVTTVYACVRILSYTLASLPLPVYRRLQPRGKERASDHPVYFLLHDKPNEYQTSFVFRSTMMTHLCLYGNAYAEIETNRQGQPTALWIIPPWMVEPKRSERGSLYYEVNIDGSHKRIPYYSMLHIMGLGTDGLKGLSPIRQAQEAIGLSMAAEQFGSKFFAQGTNAGGVVEHPGKLSETAYKNLKESMQEKYEGLGNAHRLMLLEEGMKFSRNTIPPNEAQFLETRSFQIPDIARIYGIPLHLVQETTKSTSWGSGLEEMNIGFVVHTMRPWLTNIEQELNTKLFRESERREYFSEFLVDGLLRGDTAARWESYNKGFQIGGFSVNDILELENRNPIGEEGDARFVPLNMVPLDRALEPQHEPAAQAPRQPQEPEENAAPERKERRSIDSRQSLVISYQRIFADAEARIIRREKNDILRVANKLLGQRDTGAFLDWLEKFYREHADFIKRNMAPPVESLAEALRAELLTEAESSMGVDLDDITDEYLEAFVIRHIESNHGQIKEVLRQSFEDGDQLEALEQRLNEWEEKSPGKVAANETVKLNGYLTRTILAAVGVTKLVWRNQGSKTCPFCEQLDGKVFGIEEPVIPAGQVLEADDGSEMKIYGPKSHPPIHRGCVCGLERA